MKYVNFVVFFAVLVFLSFNLWFLASLKVANNQAELKLEEIQKDQETIYRMIAHSNLYEYAQSNLILRCYHYLANHKDVDNPVQGCPECHEILQKKGENRFNGVEESDPEAKKSLDEIFQEDAKIEAENPDKHNH